MTNTPFGLGALLSVLVITGCGGQAASSEAAPAEFRKASRADVPPAAAAATAASTRDPFAGKSATPQEQAVLAFLQANLADKSNVDLFSSAIDHAVERIGLCRNAECRVSAVSERRARAAFALGQPAKVADLPFDSGDFGRMEEGYAGVARIVPLGFGSSMLVVNLSFKGEPVCSLDGMMSKGADGSFAVTSLGTEKLPDLRLVPQGRNSFTLSYADPDHQPYQVDYCAAGTSIDGTYRATK